MRQDVPPIEDAQWTPTRRERLRSLAQDALPILGSVFIPSIQTTLEKALDEPNVALARLNSLAGAKDSESYEEALGVLNESWHQLEKCFALEPFVDVERSWSFIERARAKLTISAASAEIRDSIDRLSGPISSTRSGQTPASDSSSTPNDQNLLATGRSTHELSPGPISSQTDTWDGSDCRAIGCNKARMSPFAAFCRGHHQQTVIGRVLDLKGIPLERQPSRTQRPRDYMSLVATLLQHYQAPYCCKCNQPKEGGRNYNFAFNYSGASGRTREETGTAYLCNECRLAVRKRIWTLHVPIMAAIVLIPSLLAYLSDPHDLSRTVGFWGGIAFLYFFLFFVHGGLKGFYRRSIWKCVQYKARAHGCSTGFASGGVSLTLEGGGEPRA